MNIVLCIVLIALHIVDVIQTHLWLNVWKAGPELNLFMAGIFNKYGYWPGAAFKMVVICLVCAVALIAIHKTKDIKWCNLMMKASLCYCIADIIFVVIINQMAIVEYLRR
jgi:hypothetical protein